MTDTTPDLLGALRESFERAALRRKDLAAEIARLGAELSADAVVGDAGEHADAVSAPEVSESAA